MSNSNTCNSEEASSLDEYIAKHSATFDVDDKDILYLTPQSNGLNGEDIEEEEEKEDEEEEIQWLRSIPASEVFFATPECSPGSNSVSSPALADCSDSTLTSVQQSQPSPPAREDKLLINCTQSSVSCSVTIVYSTEATTACRTRTLKPAVPSLQIAC